MNHSDRFLDESLRTFGRAAPRPGDLPDEVRANCLSAFSPEARRSRSVFGRPALVSTMGAALTAAVLLGFLFPANGGPEVRAATVLQKLSTQVAATDVLRVELNNVSVDEVAVHGDVYLTADGVAGDVSATVQGGGGAIEVDVSLGISREQGWVLVRKLRIPEPEAQVFVDLFLPRDAETLVVLPASLIEEEFGLGLGDLHELRQLASGRVAEFVRVVIESNSTAGATTRRLADGTILLNIEIHDAQTVRSLMNTIARTMGEDAEGEIDIDEDDVAELLGAKVGIIYDPATETVRAFSISGLGGIQGTITVSLVAGPVADMFDSARVTAPQTRILDLTALLNSVEGLQGILNARE